MIQRNLLHFKGPDFKTLVGRGGKPDIVLVNNHDIYNMTILAGDITTSDHIPIEVIISTKGVRKRINRLKRR